MSVTTCEHVDELIAIGQSILSHSSTDVLVARWFDDSHETPSWHGKVAGLERVGTLLSCDPVEVSLRGRQGGGADEADDADDADNAEGVLADVTKPSGHDSARET